MRSLRRFICCCDLPPRSHPGSGRGLVAFALAFSATALGATYTVTDLGALGAYGSLARGLNARGDVVGNSNGRAFLYSNGTMKDLDPRVPGNNVAYAINDAGQVVGSSYDAAGHLHAFLYSNGITTDLGFQYGEALAISATGLVAGWFNDSPCTESSGCTGSRHPFRYGSGTLTDLGGAHTSSSVANGVNASGEVVGEFPVDGGPPHAFLYSGGVMTDLGTLGGLYSNATAINSSGQVVGSAQIAGTFESHAFLYSGGAMTDLGTFATCTDLYGSGQTYTSDSAASAINSSGQIIGSFSCTYAASGLVPYRINSRPWVYSGGTMRDLQGLIDPASGWTIGDARGINDAGQIAANGCNADSCDALLLTPSRNATAVEYYDAQLDHYFMTADATEIAALDAGQFQGWVRTGQQFPVYVAALSAGSIPSWLVPVCRYYGLPSAGLDTHFFSASVEECAAVAAKWPTQWLLETPNAFYSYLPDTTDASCPSGTVPVYRLFNNRRNVNHRYTTSLASRQKMIDAGWIPEGYGSMAVGMCVLAV